MENKFEILEIINKYIDLENYAAPPINHHQDWFDKHTLINDELKEKKLIGEHQNIYFMFDQQGKIENINLQVETRCLPNEPPEEKIEVEGVENVIVRRRSFEDIEESERIERESRFDFQSEEWKNYKRTKTIDKMLNDRG